MNMLSVSLDERFCVASRQMKLDARVGAHPSDFYSGKSHQNHSLRDASLRVPCVPRQSRRKKNSGSSIPQTPFCFLRLFLRNSVASSRSRPHFQSFRRSPPLWANNRQEGSAPADEVQQSGVGSLLARRASQFLAGNKRGVSERSELASACQGQDAQSSRRPR